MPSLRQTLRYRFDNYMSRGTGAQIVILALATVTLLLLGFIAIKIYGGIPSVGDDGTVSKDNDSGKVLFVSLYHSIDSGTISGDAWAWGFLGIMLAVTVGGIFIVSALIGILNNGLTLMIESLRRGKSGVIERGHTVVLGFSPKIHTLLHELSVAGANQKDPCVVVLADVDKVAMDEELAATVEGTKLRVVTRRANPMNLADLELASLATAKSIVVLAPEGSGTVSAAAHDADTVVLKTLLAVSKVGAGSDLHVVAELQDAKTETVARMVVPTAALIVSPPLISRLLVQTGRQSGLSMVYSELLDFGGVEMYIQAQPQLAGKTFREALFLYDSSTLLGVIDAAGTIQLPPAFDRRFESGDKVIAISEDDDTVVLDGRPQELPASMMVAAERRSTRHRERTLVLGASDRLPLVLHELDAYVAPGSETVVVGETSAIDTAGLENVQVTWHTGDITNRALLDGLDVAGFDSILILSETDGREQEMADARTMITLLHLRDILRGANKKVPITSEILEIENRDLAAVAEADDFIVSNALVSLLMSQVSENRHLVKIFEDLFTAGGHEIYLKPVSEYVPHGVELPYQAIVEAAARRGEVAVGIRLAATARDPVAGFGVMVNPKKAGTMKMTAGDKVIVLADE